MGKTTSTENKIPQYLEDAGEEIVAKGRDVGQVGFTPYYGPQVAAFTPAQQQAFSNTGTMASAFGLGGDEGFMTAGIPEATEFAGGTSGYSSMPIYEESQQAFRQARPGQAAAMDQLFIDPYTGQYTGKDYSTGNVGAGVDGTRLADSLVQTVTRAPDYTPSATGGTGDWTGGPQSDWAISRMSPDEFEAYVLAEGLPGMDNTEQTFGESIYEFGEGLVNNSLIGKGYEWATGNQLMPGSRDTEESWDAYMNRIMTDNPYANGVVLGDREAVTPEFNYDPVPDWMTSDYSLSTTPADNYLAGTGNYQSPYTVLSDTTGLDGTGGYTTVGNGQGGIWEFDNDIDWGYMDDTSGWTQGYDADYGFYY